MNKKVLFLQFTDKVNNNTIYVRKMYISQFKHLKANRNMCYVTSYNFKAALLAYLLYRLTLMNAY